jgi:PTS system nitrogen regulatory IIA component
MEFVRTLDKKRICLLKSRAKDEAFLELIELTAKSGTFTDIQSLKEHIFYREQLMSTGIGLGIGIPHVRIEGVEQPFITIGINPDGIEAYESIDNQPVKIVMMIVAGKNQHKLYIELLSKIVKILKRDGIIEKLTNARDPDEIYEILLEEGQHV